MTDTLIRIRRIARPLSYATTLALIALPLGLLLAAGLGYLDEAALRAAYDVVPLPQVIPAAAWAVVITVNLISAAFLWLVLWTMRGLLSLYAMGDILGPDAARSIRRIGHLLLALAIWGVLANTVSILALTWTNPPGDRSLSIGFASTDLFALFSAGLLTVIGWAMTEAARIAEENRGFV